MIVDIHGHVNAPSELGAYKAGLLASRGAHGKGSTNVPEERLAPIVKRHVEETLDKVGTDVQFLSPRPFTLMNSEKPDRIVHWYTEACNNVIAQTVKMYPDRYRGVAGLPHVHGVSPANCAEEMERCVKDLGFVGVMINPDPSEGTDLDMPTMGDEYWYPLYEKMVELDVPALIHTAACKNTRETYSNHFITEEGIQTLSLVNSSVFQDFPKLKIIMAHGGGSIPYQVGRWRAGRFNARARGAQVELFDESLRRLYFDTVLYNQESMELLFKIVGTDRCMFGTENPGTGTAKDPETGNMLDDLKPVIQDISWLTDQDRKNLFEDVAKEVFPRFGVS